MKWQSDQREEDSAFQNLLIETFTKQVFCIVINFQETDTLSVIYK